MPVIRLPESGKILEYEPGKTLLDILAGAGVMPPSPCGGAGVCGKCMVTLVGGDVPEPGGRERELYSEEILAGGRRLACLVYPEGDLDVSVPDEGKAGSFLAGGHLPDFVLDPPLVKKTVAVDLTPADTRGRRVAAALGEESLAAGLLRDLPPDCRRVTALYERGRVVALEAGDEPRPLYGLAVDIGTTTVVVSLVDLETGRELAARSAVNPQRNQGGDVPSRLGFIMEHPGHGLSVLQESIVGCLNDLAGEVRADAGARLEDVRAVAVAANTVMMHVLLGIDPSPMGRAPFTPVFTGAKSLTAADIGLRAGKGAVLYCLPSVSAHIGADLVAGMHVAGLRAARETILFVDIGTNGAIVLSHKGTLRACSCAAGPALEGVNISCGLRASAGAVEEVRIRRRTIKLQTIGNAPPVGLCGSGILSAVCEFLRIGLIRPQGDLVNVEELAGTDPRRAHLCIRDGQPALRLRAGDNGLYLTRQDIRQVQLAKGAILSGVLALLERSGLTMDDVNRVYIAGPFGAHLSPDSLTGCGIIPEAPGDRITYLGNTSKNGALLSLLSTAAREDMEAAIAGEVEYLELNALEGFDRKFAACLDFPLPSPAGPA